MNNTALLAVVLAPPPFETSENECDREQSARKTNRLAIISLICGIVGALAYSVILLIIPNIQLFDHTSGDTQFLVGMILLGSALLLLFHGSCSGLIGLVSGILAIWQIKKKAEGEKGIEWRSPVSFSDYLHALWPCILISTRDKLFTPGEFFYSSLK